MKRRAEIPEEEQSNQKINDIEAQYENICHNSSPNGVTDFCRYFKISPEKNLKKKPLYKVSEQEIKDIKKTE